MTARNITATEFQELLCQEELVLVDFWAPWCGYCRRIGPAYDIIAQQQEGKIAVTKVNIDQEEALAAQEQIEVIPTLVLYRKGQAIGSIVAPDSKAMIDRFLTETLSAQKKED